MRDGPAVALRTPYLISTGRQGLFRYGNMDHSIAMGARVAKTLATGQGPDHGEVATEDESFD